MRPDEVAPGAPTLRLCRDPGLTPQFTKHTWADACIPALCPKVWLREARPQVSADGASERVLRKVEDSSLQELALYAKGQPWAGARATYDAVLESLDLNRLWLDRLNSAAARSQAFEE